MNYSTERCIIYGADEDTIEAVAILLTARNNTNNPTVASALEALRLAVFMVDSEQVARQIKSLDDAKKDYIKLKDLANEARAIHMGRNLARDYRGEISQNGRWPRFSPIPEPKPEPKKKWWQW